MDWLQLATIAPQFIALIIFIVADERRSRMHQATLEKKDETFAAALREQREQFAEVMAQERLLQRELHAENIQHQKQVVDILTRFETATMTAIKVMQDRTGRRDRTTDK